LKSTETAVCLAVEVFAYLFQQFRLVEEH